MLKLKKFQKNIVMTSQESEWADNLDNCLIDITENRLKLFKNGVIILDSELKLIEQDFSTTSYIANKSDGSTFRVIRPSATSLNNLKQRFECESAFSVASISPNEYAVHYLLVNAKNNDEIDVEQKGIAEQINRLIEGSILALQFNLQSNFIDYTKRILSILKNADDLRAYEGGNKILSIIMANPKIYSEFNNKL